MLKDCLEILIGLSLLYSDLKVRDTNTGRKASLTHSMLIHTHLAGANSQAPRVVSLTRKIHHFLEINGKNRALAHRSFDSWNEV